MSPTCTDTPSASESRAPSEQFDDVILPHLNDARRLSRWLVGNEDDAEDVLQEALLRALRYFRTFSGRNGRGWLLTIVRNTSRAWHRRTPQPANDVFDEDLHTGGSETLDPEALLLQADTVGLLEEALDGLPVRFRELLVRREIEEFTYLELADELKVPIGTVMSGLSRARQALRTRFLDLLEGTCGPEDVKPAAGPGIKDSDPRSHYAFETDSTFHHLDVRLCPECRRGGGRQTTHQHIAKRSRSTWIRSRGVLE